MDRILTKEFGVYRVGRSRSYWRRGLDSRDLDPGPRAQPPRFIDLDFWISAAWRRSSTLEAGRTTRGTAASSALADSRVPIQVPGGCMRIGPPSPQISCRQAVALLRLQWERLLSSHELAALSTHLVGCSSCRRAPSPPPNELPRSWAGPRGRRVLESVSYVGGLESAVRRLCRYLLGGVAETT